MAVQLEWHAWHDRYVPAERAAGAGRSILRANRCMRTRLPNLRAPFLRNIHLIRPASLHARPSSSTSSRSEECLARSTRGRPYCPPRNGAICLHFGANKMQAGRQGSLTSLAPSRISPPTDWIRLLPDIAPHESDRMFP